MSQKTRRRGLRHGPLTRAPYHGRPILCCHQKAEEMGGPHVAGRCCDDAAHQHRGVNKDGGWAKMAMLRSGAEWKKSPSVPLVLYRGHYFTLKVQKRQWPRERAQESAERIPCLQGIETHIAEMMNAVLIPGGMFATPLKKKVKKHMKSSPVDDDGLGS